MDSNNDPIIECIPNLCEGKNPKVINEVRDLFKKYNDLSVLDVYIGYDTNRSVFTLVGRQSVIFPALKDLFLFASEHLSIEKAGGDHPHIGILDVIPFVPLRKGATDRLVEAVNQFSMDVATEFDIPVITYGYLDKGLSLNLGPIRKGGVSRLEGKINSKELIPDYGPRSIHPELGATLIGVRDFMAAFNINLLTKDIQKAKLIAKRLIAERNEGSLGQEDGVSLDSLRVLAWYIPEYNFCQISTNIYDLNALKVDEVFRLVDTTSREFGVETCGSELIGMIPLRGLSRNRDTEKVILEIGLDSLHPFIPEKRILEFRLDCDSFL